MSLRLSKTKLTGLGNQKIAGMDVHLKQDTHLGKQSYINLFGCLFLVGNHTGKNNNK